MLTGLISYTLGILLSLAAISGVILLLDRFAHSRRAYVVLKVKENPKN